MIDYYEAFDEGLPNILSIPKEITVTEPNVIDPETNQPSVRRKRIESELGDLGQPKKNDVFFDKGTSDFNSTELTYNLP